MTIWRTFVLFAIFFIFQSQAYTCSVQPVTVKYQGVPYFFPPQGTDDHYDSNLNCTWIIQIPDGYYLEWGLQANLTVAFPKEFSDYVRVVYNEASGSTEADYYQKQDLEFKLISDKLIINLNTHDKTGGSFHFNVTWIKIAPTTPIVLTAFDDFGYSAFELSDMNENHTVAFSISKDAQVVLSIDWIGNENLGDIWVYDGIGATGTDYFLLLDSLFMNIHSKNHAFTLYNPFSNAPLDHAVVLAQDSRNVHQFEESGVFYNLPSANRTVGLTVKKQDKKPNAITFYSPNNAMVTIFEIDFDTKSSGAVYAYVGVATTQNIDHPDVTFSPNDNPSQLPYYFNSSIVTFVMKTEGEAMLYSFPHKV